MVIVKKSKNCKTCNQNYMFLDKRYIFCIRHKMKVWAESEACSDYDDTKIF